MDPNTCCSRKTCPKNQMALDAEGSSQKSSGPEYSDKQTERATDLSSDVASATSSQPAQGATTSETHFNRNNENLSTPQQPSCPTNTPQFNRACSHLYPPMAHYPSIIAQAACHHECPCMIPSRDQTTSSSQHRRTAGTETSTSSSSNVSEHFPLRVILNSKNVAHITPIPYPSPWSVPRPKRLQPWSGPRPERLQPCCTDDQPFATPKSPTATVDDEYYSCSSESSDSDTPSDQVYRHPMKMKCRHRNLAVLQLLHQVIHLITEDTSTRDDVNPSQSCDGNSKSSSLPNSFNRNDASSTRANFKIRKPQESPQPDTSSPFGAQGAVLDACGPCSELRAFLDKGTHNTDGFQSPSDECPCSETKLTFSFGEQRTRILSSSTNEFEDCGCTSEETAHRITAELPYSQFVPPPWPCYCYYRAALASAQGVAMPIPKTTGHCPMYSPINMGGPTQRGDREELICTCSKMVGGVCPKHGSTNDMTKVQETADIKATEDDEEKPTDSDYIDEELHPRILGIVPLEHCQDYQPYPECIMPYDDEEPYGMENSGLSKPDKEAKAKTGVLESEYVDEELHPRILGIIPLEHCQDYQPYPECIMPYDDEEPYGMENSGLSKPDKEAKAKTGVLESEYVDEELHPRILGIIPLEHCQDYEPYPDCIMPYDDEEPYGMKNSGTVEYLPKQDNEAKAKNEFIESECVDEELHPQMLGIVPLEHCQDYEPYPDCVPPYDDEEPYGITPLGTVDVYEDDCECHQQALLDEAYAKLQDSLFPPWSYVGGRVCEELTSDCELEKEKIAEMRKSRSHKDPCNCCHCQANCRNEQNECTTLATTQKVASGVDEFKYFIDSIIMDLDAMEHARRKCDILKNVCGPKPGVCSRESFPVTIIAVQDLGATSLYVKWTIHDCCGVGGYEIYVDGYLTNRYYHSRHEAAVVTDVDITIPHKVALVAQPSTGMLDDSLEMLCHPSKVKVKCKSLLWKGEVRTVSQGPASLWTPSIYLYDPAQSKASPVLPILSDHI